MDLFFSTLSAALALLFGAWGLPGGGGGMPTIAVSAKTVAYAGIAIFGVFSDITLLRRKPMNAVFVKIALIFVGMDMMVSMHATMLKLAGPDTTYPPETIIAGAIMSLFIRTLFNIVWFETVRRALRHLGRLPSPAAAS